MRVGFGVGWERKIPLISPFLKRGEWAVPNQESAQFLASDKSLPLDRTLAFHMELGDGRGILEVRWVGRGC